MAVLRGRACAQLLAFADRSHVAHPDRHAFAPIQHDVADGFQIGQLARHAHQELLAIAFDVARADVLVVASDGLLDIVQGETQRDQLRRIGCDVDLPLVAADGVDLGHARHVAKLRADHPVLQGAKISRRIG